MFALAPIISKNKFVYTDEQDWRQGFFLSTSFVGDGWVPLSQAGGVLLTPTPSRMFSENFDQDFDPKNGDLGTF